MHSLIACLADRAAKSSCKDTAKILLSPHLDLSRNYSTAEDSNPLVLLDYHQIDRAGRGVQTDCGSCSFKPCGTAEDLVYWECEGVEVEVQAGRSNGSMGSHMKRTATRILLPCLLVASLFGCGRSDDRVVARAKHSVAAGKSSEALRLLDDYLVQSPHSIEPRRLKILLAIDIQRSWEAVADYEAISSLRVKDDDGLLHLLALGLIRDSLQRNEGLLRSRAATALTELADTSADWLLQRSLEHQDPSVRAQAATAVGRLRHRPLLHEMVRLLGDPDPFVRVASAWTLGQMGEPSAYAPLRQALHDPHPQVRIRAAGALVLLGDRSAIVLLTDALGAKDPAVRIQAADVLGAVSEPSTRAALTRRLQDPDLYVRLYAAEALAKLGDPSAVTYLRTVLAQRNRFLGMFAAELLSNLGDRSVVPLLREVLEDNKDIPTRLYAAWTLGRLGDPSGLAAAREALNHSDPDLRANAVWTLGAIGGDEVIALLREALRDEALTVKMQALWALDRLVRSADRPSAAPTAGKLL